MKNHLVISALVEDRPGLVESLARTIVDCGCNIVDSRMTVLGSEFAALMLVYGNWNTLAKLEVQLEKLEKNLKMQINWRRTAPRTGSHGVLPYAIEVIALDQAGIVCHLASFFAARSINVEDLTTRSYLAPHTATPMFAVNMVVGIPADQHIAMIREEFMDFCDDLNLDAVMEPVKA